MRRTFGTVSLANRKCGNQIDQSSFNFSATRAPAVRKNHLPVSVFFLLFLGPKFGPIPLIKKYVFFPPILNEIPLKMKFKKINKKKIIIKKKSMMPGYFDLVNMRKDLHGFITAWQKGN